MSQVALTPSHISAADDNPLAVALALNHQAALVAQSGHLAAALHGFRGALRIDPQF
jgi:hypothetical protein